MLRNSVSRFLPRVRCPKHSGAGLYRKRLTVATAPHNIQLRPCHQRFLTFFSRVLPSSKLHGCQPRWYWRADSRQNAMRTFVDEVRSGSSYISNNDMRVHFGRGAATKIDWVEINWPSVRALLKLA